MWRCGSPQAGHQIVGVHVPPDRSPAAGREDPLAAEAEKNGWPLFRHKAYRRKGRREARAGRRVSAPGRRAERHALHDGDPAAGDRRGAEPRLALLSSFSAAGVPRRKRACLADHHGCQGDGGDRLSTGRGRRHRSHRREQKGGVPILDSDNTASLYFDRLYPLGVDAMAEAVDSVANGSATFTPQTEAGASFQGLVDDEVARIDWSPPGRRGGPADSRL